MTEVKRDGNGNETNLVRIRAELDRIQAEIWAAWNRKRRQQRRPAVDEENTP